MSIKTAAILAIGGCGAMGRATTKLIAETYGAGRLTIADFNRSAADQWATSLNRDWIDSAFIDLNKPDTFGALFAAYDLVLNLAPYSFNNVIMAGCVEGNCHYIDLGGLYHRTVEQLKLDDAFKKIGKTAALGMGASPGMANLAAEACAKDLDAVKEIHIRTGAKGGQGGFPYSPVTILEEATFNPMVCSGGKVIQAEPLSGEQTYRMPEPIGEVTGFYSIHSELATLPFRYPGIQEVSFRVAFSHALVQGVKALVAYGLTSREALDLGNGTSLSRWDFLVKHLETLPRASGYTEQKSFRVSGLGVKNGNNKTVQYEVIANSRPDWELTATSVWTGFPAAVAAKLILDGKAEAGARAPEALFELPQILPELAKVGLAIVPSPESELINHS